MITLKGRITIDADTEIELKPVEGLTQADLLEALDDPDCCLSVRHKEGHGTIIVVTTGRGGGCGGSNGPEEIVATAEPPRESIKWENVGVYCEGKKIEQ